MLFPRAKNIQVLPMCHMWATGKTELMEVFVGSVCPRSHLRELARLWILAVDL